MIGGARNTSAVCGRLNAVPVFAACQSAHSLSMKAWWRKKIGSAGERLVLIVPPIMLWTRPWDASSADENARKWGGVTPLLMTVRMPGRIRWEPRMECATGDAPVDEILRIGQSRRDCPVVDPVPIGDRDERGSCAPRARPISVMTARLRA